MHYFNTELSPLVERTTKSMNSRWSEMESTYKYLDFHLLLILTRYICDFNANRVNGSTGMENWWVLSKYDQKIRLNPPEERLLKKQAGKKPPKTKVYFLLL